MTKFFNITISVDEDQMKNEDFSTEKGIREYACRKLNRKIQQAEREFTNPIKLIKFDEIIETVYKQHGTKFTPSPVSEVRYESPNIVAVKKCTISAYFKVDLTEKFHEED